MFDYVLQFGKLLGTSIGKAGGLLAQVTGIGALDPDDTDDSAGELASDEAMFAAPGVVARPLPPETIDGMSVHAEVICARTSDGLVPIGTRDVRLERAHSGLKPGSVALAGYGRAFFSHDLADPGALPANRKNISTTYVPTAFDAEGNPTRALLITVNGDDESITLLTGGTNDPGVLLTLQQADQSVTMQTTDGATAFRLEPGKLTIQAAQIILNGTVVVGDPFVAVPLLAGAASPPCPRLFVAPTP